jgi:RNA recognition motif-containing protein
LFLFLYLFLLAWSTLHQAVPQPQQQSMMSPVATMSPQQSNRLFVGGLNEITSDEQLGQHFSQFGEVTDCYIPKEKSGKQRGYGY